MKYMVVLTKMAADAWKPAKLEIPKLQLPKLKLPTLQDAMNPKAAEQKKRQQEKAREQQETMAHPGSMDVTIKFHR